MVLARLFKPRASVEAGRRLYARAVEQARIPAFYADLGVPDTSLGRFELYTLHALLLVRRIKGPGVAATETTQALFDAYVEGLDIALREMGVGDLSVGKKMKKLGRAFYGRLGSWETTLAGLPDLGPVTALVARTVYEGVEGADSTRLSAYAVRAAAVLAAQSDEALLKGEVSWPSVTP